MKSTSKKVTADDCKDRLDKLTKNSVKGTWTPDEDQAILRGYQKYGRNWALIAKKLEGRSGK